MSVPAKKQIRRNTKSNDKRKGKKNAINAMNYCTTRPIPHVVSTYIARQSL